MNHLETPPYIQLGPRKNFPKAEFLVPLPFDPTQPHLPNLPSDHMLVVKYRDPQTDTDQLIANPPLSLIQSLAQQNLISLYSLPVPHH